MIYFSEYYYSSGFHGQIVKASLTGASKTVILDTDIEFVTDMALDLVTETLYWVDYNLDQVERCSANGHNREVLFESSTSGLDIVDDIIYFTTQGNIEAIYANGEDVSTFDSPEVVSGVYGLKVVGPYTQGTGKHNSQKLEFVVYLKSLKYSLMFQMKLVWYSAKNMPIFTIALND